MTNEAFYQDVAPIYDRMIRWERRLAVETPLFEALWRRTGARRALDAACGSGRHLVLFARQGMEATGADASESMLALAREQVGALPSARRPRLIQSTWAELPDKVPQTFDAALCLGNSLPYVTEPAALRASLEGLWSRVGPGGFLLIQFKNFARLRARGERFLPLSSHLDPDTGAETVCVRQYEWRERTVDFHIIVLTRDKPAETAPPQWAMRHWVTPLATYRAADVTPILERGGAQCALCGSLALEPFDEAASEDVVIMAERP